MEVVIIGAGLTGLLLSIYLAKRGYQVKIYDQRPKPDKSYDKYNQGRSMSLDLSLRGLRALSAIGLDQKVLSYTIPMKNRIIHMPDKELIHLQYDARDKHTIHAISRSELHHYLLTEIEKLASITIYFQHKLLAIDLNTNQFTFKDENQTELRIVPPLVIGCDGAHSMIRKSFENAQQATFKVTHFDYQYKELTIPVSAMQSLEFQAMHMWPRRNQMLVAQPNYNGSFTCALLLPIKGEYSFEHLLNQSHENINAYFKNQFNDVYLSIPDLTNQLINNPLGHLVSISEGRWSYNKKILLLGDAVHAMLPFLGQGMNACFEDCYLLNQYLDRYHDNWDLVMTEFEKDRKMDTNTISTMSLENYPELIYSDWQNYILHREIDDFLSKNYEDCYVSFHNLICFDVLPYHFVYSVRALQTELIKNISLKFNNIKKITKENIQDDFRQYQEKFKHLILPSIMV